MRDRIIKAMREKGIQSMAELERQAGLPSGTLRNMGQGHMPSTDKVRKIASTLGITVDYIINGNESDAIAVETTIKSKTEPGKKSGSSIKEFAAVIASLSDQNMEALVDYARYLLSKQERD